MDEGALGSCEGRDQRVKSALSSDFDRQCVIWFSSRSEVIFTLDFVCLVGTALQVSTRRLTLTQYLQFPRALVKTFAGQQEDGEIHPNEEGTPQGGSISVLLSNVYLHYVLDLWFERVVKPRLRGEACMVRYIDDFVLCFQYRSDALRVQEALAKRLGRFSLTLEPTKTKLVEFGRFAHRHASNRGRKRPQTIYFLGFTLYCTRNQKGNFRIGFRTERSRLRRALLRLQDQMRRMRHSPLQEQADHLNRMLRGHDAYYGIAGNLRSLLKVHRAVERYWRKMLSSRSWHGTVRWEQFQQIKSQFPLLTPKLQLPYPKLQAIAKL